MGSVQGWEFALLLFRSSLLRSLLFCSKLLILKSDWEQFSLVILQKEANVSSCCYKRAMSMIHSWYEQTALKNEWFAQKTFLYFWQFFPLFISKSKLLPSLFTICDLLLSLFKKERLWANHSHRSWQKSDANDSLFFTNELLFCSFTHKKRAIRWFCYTKGHFCLTIRIFTELYSGSTNIYFL